MLDFKKIINENKINNIINPREIFMSLPNRKYDYPRDVQTEVWRQWIEKREECAEFLETIVQAEELYYEEVKGKKENA